MIGHRPRVFLTRTETGTPYKWAGRCPCGWHCLSWQWRRDDGSGAFPMAFAHAAETEGNAQRAFFAGRRSLDADIAELERQIEEYKQTLTEMGVDVDD